MKDILYLEGIEFWIALFALSHKEKDKVYDVESNRIFIRNRASSWDKCACCELKDHRRRKAILTEVNDPPINWILEDKGVDFASAIWMKKWDKAEQLFKEIQEIVALENKLPSI